MVQFNWIAEDRHNLLEERRQLRASGAALRRRPRDQRQRDEVWPGRDEYVVVDVVPRVGNNNERVGLSCTFIRSCPR